MSLLLESIRIVDGCWMNMEYHQRRAAKSSLALFGTEFLIDSDVLFIPEEFRTGVVKCRIVYDTEIREIGFDHYTPRKLSTLKLVYDDEIDYSHKWADRSSLNRLVLEKGNADEILIVKNGKLSDISYANIVLKINGKHYTPSTCLLEGTRRQQLLDDGLIAEKVLTVEDLKHASSVIIINAMLGLEDGIEITIQNIEM